jgi:hypothetical protein
MIRGRMPSAILKYYWDACHHASEGRQSLLDCGPPDEEFNLRVVLDGFASDEDLISALRFWVDSQALLILLSNIDLRVAQDLVIAIEAST